jgi:hypothetical protein
VRLTSRRLIVPSASGRRNPERPRSGSWHNSTDLPLTCLNLGDPSMAESEPRPFTNGARTG